MIPTIGLMIGSYILLRCLDIMCRHEGQFQKAWHRTLMVVVAIFTYTWVSICILSLVTGTQKLPEVVR